MANNTNTYSIFNSLQDFILRSRLNDYFAHLHTQNVKTFINVIERPIVHFRSCEHSKSFIIIQYETMHVSKTKNSQEK